MSNSIRTTIRKHLLAGVAKQSGVDAMIAELDAARAGMYTHGILAAIAAKGDSAAFTETCDTLRDDFRANRRGIAIKFKCDVAKDKQGNKKADSDGNPVYKVPSSLSSMASHLKSAFEFGVDLGTKAKPSAFRAVRDACQLARDTAKAANATPEDQYRDGLKSQLNDLATQLDGLPLPALKVINKLLAVVVKGVEGAVAHPNAA